jgi:hypothetical protein
MGCAIVVKLGQDGAPSGMPSRDYLKSRGAKSLKARRHVSHSCAVPDDSKYTL